MSSKRRSTLATGDLIREVRLNFASSMPLNITLALLTASILAAGTYVVGIDVTRLQRSWDARRDAGSFAWEVRSDAPAGIPVSQCESLNTLDSVKGAGAVLGLRTVTLLQQPGRARQLVLVSPGFVRAAWHDAPPELPDIIAGHDLSVETGMRSHTQIAYRDSSGSEGSLTVAWSADSPSKIEGLDSALVVVSANSANIQECLVEAMPGAHEDVGEVLTGWFPPELHTLPVDILRVDPRTADSPDSSLKSRLTRWVGPASGCALLGLKLLEWWMRRRDYALYRLLGMRRSELVRLLNLEILLQTYPAAATGFFAGLVMLSGRPGVVTVDLTAITGLQVMASLILLPLAGLLILGGSKTVDVLKGR